MLVCSTVFNFVATATATVDYLILSSSLSLVLLLVLLLLLFSAMLCDSVVKTVNFTQ